MDKLAIVATMIRECEDHTSTLSADRQKAVEYYDGKMTDTPSDEGRSKVISRDVRANIKKVLPSIVRTILNGDEVVEYQPVNEGDEEGAQQASDYINYVAFPESDGRQAIYDAVHDALLLRNGIIRWWWDEKKSVSVSRHSGLSEEALALLVSGDDVEVLEHSTRPEQMDSPNGPMEIEVHDVRIKRMRTNSKACVAAVPPEEFLIHPDAVDLDNSPVVGQKSQLSRSDLIAMGYDRKVIDSLSIAGEDNTASEAEKFTRRDTYDEKSELEHALQEVDYYDLYIRVDMDDDGIAELRHMCYAGGLSEKNLLLNEECDEVQFADVAIMRRPHQWEGISIADDLMEIQRVKTVLMRQTLDNIYWQNNLQPIVQEGTVEDMGAVLQPKFGLPIRVRAGMDVRQALGYNNVPFVAKDSFAMLEYLDGEAMDRTGISDASSGLAPDALQNMTAKASAMVEQQGVGQTELMVRTAADGLRRMFRGLLRLIIRHQDKPRTVRLRDEWVEYDPRQWNAEMDCTVNTGLGAGTRERDMMMMQMVMGAQEKLLAGFGPDNPFVKPDNVYAALSKLIESAGLKTPALYFTEPDPVEVQQKLEAIRNQPNPEEMKVRAQMEMEQAKMQMQMQLEQAKMATARDKEMAQMEADLQVKQAEMDASTRAQAEQIQADSIKEQQRATLEREKLAQQREIELAKLAQQREIALMNAGMKEGENGETVSKEDERHMETRGFLQNLAEIVGGLQREMGRPKRVIYDETGDVIGVEAYDPEPDGMVN